MEVVVIYFLLIAVMMIIFIVLPGKKRQRQKHEILKTIAPGDTVITIGGIVAAVVAREENTLILQLNENSDSHIRILQEAVQGVSHKK